MGLKKGVKKSKKTYIQYTCKLPWYMVYRDVKSTETKQMDEGGSLETPPGWEEENQLEPRYTWQVHWSDATCVQSVQNVPAASCVPSAPRIQ